MYVCKSGDVNNCAIRGVRCFALNDDDAAGMGEISGRNKENSNGTYIDYL